MPQEPLFKMSSTYFRVVDQLFPKSSGKGQWKACGNYLVDICDASWGDVSTGLKFHEQISSHVRHSGLEILVSLYGTTEPFVTNFFLKKKEGSRVYIYTPLNVTVSSLTEYSVLNSSRSIISKISAVKQAFSLLAPQLVTLILLNSPRALICFPQRANKKGTGIKTAPTHPNTVIPQLMPIFLHMGFINRGKAPAMAERRNVMAARALALYMVNVSIRQFIEA